MLHLALANQIFNQAGSSSRVQCTTVVAKPTIYSGPIIICRIGYDRHMYTARWIHTQHSLCCAHDAE